MSVVAHSLKKNSAVAIGCISELRGQSKNRRAAAVNRGVGNAIQFFSFLISGYRGNFYRKPCDG